MILLHPFRRGSGKTRCGRPRATGVNELIEEDRLPKDAVTVAAV